MSATIILERIGHGLDLNDSYTFFRRLGYEEKPITIPGWWVAAYGTGPGLYGVVLVWRLTLCQRWRHIKLDRICLANSCSAC